MGEKWVGEEQHMREEQEVRVVGAWEEKGLGNKAVYTACVAPRPKKITGYYPMDGPTDHPTDGHTLI